MEEQLVSAQHRATPPMLEHCSTHQHFCAQYSRVYRHHQCGLSHQTGYVKDVDSLLQNRQILIFFFHKHLHRIVNDSQSWETLIHEVIWMTTQVVVILSFDILHVVDLSIFEFLFHFSAAFTFEEFFRFIMDKSPPSKTFTNRPILSEWVLEERNSQFILIEYHRQISIAFIFRCINLQSSNSLSLFKNPHPLQLVIAQDFHRFSWDWVFQVFSYDKILFFDIYCWFGAMSLCYCFADYSLTSFLIASKIYFVEVDRFSLILKMKIT